MLSLNKTLPEAKTLLSCFKTLSLSERVPAFGLICALISTLFCSLQSVIVRLVNDLHAIEILFIRFGFQFIVFGIVSIINNHTLFGPKQNRYYLAVRCVSGTIAVSCIYVAFRLIPIADATTILFSSPIIVIIIAYFIFKEPITMVQTLTVLFTLIGVTCIAKPEYLFGAETETIHLYRLEGTLLAIMGAICFAVAQISNQKINATPVAINVMWFSVTCMLCGITIVGILDELVLPNDAKSWSLLLGCGICGVGESYFLTVAFRYEKAASISVTTTFNIVFTFIWGMVILSERPQSSSIAGACIVCSCIVALALRKWFEDNRSQFERVIRALFFVNANHDSPKESYYIRITNEQIECA